MAAFLAVLTWKMAVYVAVLVGFSFALARVTKQRDEARLKLELERAAHRNTCDAMADQQKMIDHWRATANAATAQALQAQAKADEGKARFDALAAKLQATPVPQDAAGALGWLAEAAKDISKGVAL